MIELVDGAEWLGISSIVIGELLVGFLAGSQPARNQEVRTSSPIRS